MMDNNFLAVNKDYFSMGLKSIDLLIIAQIEEFRRNGRECYMTNEQFSDLFGESVNTIKRSIKKLEQQKIINRSTFFVEGNGRSNRQRILSVNSTTQWKAHNGPTINDGRPKMDSPLMEGSNSNNGRLKNEEWKAHNGPIKENKKENKKDNNIYKNNFDYLFVNGNDEDIDCIVDSWETNMDSMSLDEWAEEAKADFFTYSVDELKAIADYYSL